MSTIARRNNSIDIFRYFCAVLVVIIHTEPFYTGDLSALGVFLKEYLARIAVPFFFVVSGYFLFLKIDRDDKVAYRSAWRLFKIYLFWSIPYFLINIWVVHDEGTSMLLFVKECVADFFIYGSYFHFWFFPALIYSTLIVYFLYKLCGFKALKWIGVGLFIVGCLGSSYLAIGSNIPLLSDLYALESFTAVRRIFMTGIPFVILGGWIANSKAYLKLNSSKKEVYALVITVVAFVFEKCIFIFLSWPVNEVNTVALFPLVAIIVMVLLNHPFEGKELFAQKARVCANFIYYIHPAFLLISDRAFSAVLHIKLSGVMNFMLTTIVLTLVGLLLNKIKFIRKLLS